MGKFNEGLQALNELELVCMKERERIAEAIKEIIRGVGQNPKVTEHKKFFTVKASDVLGKAWSPKYHDWRAQAELLIDVLNNFPLKEWESLMREWVARADPNFRAITVKKVQLNTEFIEEVLKRI